MKLKHTVAEIAAYLGYSPREYESFRAHAPMHFLALCDRTMEIEERIKAAEVKE